MPILPVVHIPLNLPQVQIMQCIQHKMQPRCNIRVTSQALWASVTILNVKVHENTIRLNKYDLFGRDSRKSLFKKYWHHGLGLQSCICTNHKTSQFALKQMRLMGNCLAIMHRQKIKQDVSRNTSNQLLSMIVEE